MKPIMSGDNPQTPHSRRRPGRMRAALEAGKNVDVAVISNVHPLRSNS